MNNDISLHFKLLSRKTNDKIQKNHFGPFHMGKNEFSWKKGLCQVLDIPITYHRPKHQKKLMTPA